MKEEIRRAITPTIAMAAILAAWTVIFVYLPATVSVAHAHDASECPEPLPPPECPPTGYILIEITEDEMVEDKPSVYDALKSIQEAQEQMRK